MNVKKMKFHHMVLFNREFNNNIFEVKKMVEKPYF